MIRIGGSIVNVHPNDSAGIATPGESPDIADAARLAKGGMDYRNLRNLKDFKRDYLSREILRSQFCLPRMKP